jgi:hypothetical protein
MQMQQHSHHHPLLMWFFLKVQLKVMDKMVVGFPLADGQALLIVAWGSVVL